MNQLWLHREENIILLKTDRKLILISCLLSLVCAFAACLFGVSLLSAVKFAVFQIFIVMLPGFALYSLLLKNREASAIGYISISYALGYALNIIEYFFTALIGLSSVSALIVAAVCTVALCLPVIVKKDDVSIKWEKNDYIFAGIFFIFLIAIFLGYSLKYLAPSDGVSRKYHADALFWVENASALKKVFPPEEFRLAGTPLFYHYFASIWVAFASLITGADTFNIAYALYPLGKCLLLFGGLYVTAKIWFEKNYQRILFMIILLFTTGFEKYSAVNVIAHIVILPFGFDISYAYGACFLSLLYLQYKESEFDWQLSLLAGISFLMCAGHKAPVALVCLAFAGVVCIYWLIKKQFGKAFVNGGLAASFFMLVMVVCVGFLTGAESRVNAGKFTHCGLLMASPLYEEYQAVALSSASSASKLLAYFSAMVKLILSIQPVIYFLVTVGVVFAIVRKRFDIIDLALVIMFASGTLFGLFNFQEGVSQMYYCMAAFIPGAIFGLRHLEFNKVLSIVLGVLILFFGYKFVSGIGFNSNAGDDLSISDYQALCWVRDNTSPDSIIVSDKSVISDIDNYMCYGVFSERANYLEGDRYFYGTYLDKRENRRKVIRDLYLNDSEALNEVSEFGCDYIIQTKSVTPAFEGVGCTKAYESDSMVIWEIDK